jgi:hypothetical protein
MDDQENELSEAMHEALDTLALQLGGTSETGGPVENATQIKGRDELGVLLTDAHNRVLGRVWLEFGASAQSPDFASLSGGAGSLGFHAHVRSEAVQPPVPLELWLQNR